MSRSSKRSKVDIVPYHHTAGSIPRRSRSWTATVATMRRRSTTTSSMAVLLTGDLVDNDGDDDGGDDGGGDDDGGEDGGEDGGGVLQPAVWACHRRVWPCWKMVLHLDRCFLLPGLTIMRRTTIVSRTEAKKNRSTLLTGSNHDVQENIERCLWQAFC